MYSAGVARVDFEETAEELSAIEALIMNNLDILSNDRSAPAKTGSLRRRITSCDLLMSKIASTLITNLSSF